MRIILRPKNFSPAFQGKSFLSAIHKDSFLRNNAILFIGSLVTAVLNYAYHPILSRLMEVEAFGEVQAVLSIIAQIGVITGVFALVATNLVANKDSDASRLKTNEQLQSLAMVVSLLIAVGIVLAAPLLQSTLHFVSIWPFVALAAAVLTTAPIAFYTAWFRGIHDFISVALLGNLQAAGKLLFAVLFVFFGWGAFGAVFAFFCTGVVVIAYGAWKARGKVRLALREFPRITPALKNEFRYGVLVLFGTGFVTLLSTSDVVIVKALFSPEEAGLYSGIATIARIIFFLTGSISMVLLPSVKLSAGHATNTRLLLKSLLFLLLLGGSALGFFTLFPEFTVRLLIGERYATLSPLLPHLGLLLFLVSAVNLLVMYMLALRRFFLIPLALAGMILLAVLIFLFHASLTQVINDFLIVTVLALAGLAVFGTRKTPA